MEQLTVVILSWLRDAIAWQLERDAAEAGSQTDASPGEEVSKDTTPDRIPVTRHIYDVSQEEGIQKLNGWLAARHSPLRFGGIFHAGVEVNGLEWSYGMSCSESMT